MSIFTKASLLFSAIGAVFVIVAIFITISNFQFLQTATKTSGNVIDLIKNVDTDSDGDTSTTYTPVVSFTTSTGQKVETKTSISSNPPSHEIGDSVAIYYSPKEPKKIMIDSFMDKYFLPIIFGAFGLIFSAIGGFGLLKAKKKNDEAKLLQANGQRIDSTFVEVRPVMEVTINGRNPWKIVSKWVNLANGQTYFFESSELMFDPTNYMTGQTITVFIDPSDPKKYYMDITFLPKGE